MLLLVVAGIKQHHIGASPACLVNAATPRRHSTSVLKPGRSNTRRLASRDSLSLPQRRDRDMRPSRLARGKFKDDRLAVLQLQEGAFTFWNDDGLDPEGCRDADDIGVRRQERNVKNSTDRG